MHSELNNIANRFTIKDLENLSDIKAHTIRIWEKRYTMLEPSRTESNIRYYDLENLQKLLNVALLYNSGMKISKIADLEKNELITEVRSRISIGNGKEQHVGDLMMAMLTFDQNKFEHTYNKLTAEASFREIFLDVFVPLLHKLGLEWQSQSINPAHEHFISNLIKQKLLINIEKVQQPNSSGKDKTYVLFLPDNEIHEFGMLYVHYELLLKGKDSIFLGSSVPMSSLKSVSEIFPEIQYISYFTVNPAKEEVVKYLGAFQKELLSAKNDSLWVGGRNTEGLDLPSGPKNVQIFGDLRAFLKEIS
jgi:DNA-binding transcriptional MerR regulator